MVVPRATGENRVSDYEIRLFKPGGSPSITMAVVANGPSAARGRAWEMLQGGVVKAEIWNGDDHIETIVAF
jgi:hypothetical protein